MLYSGPFGDLLPTWLTGQSHWQPLERRGLVRTKPIPQFTRLWFLGTSLTHPRWCDHLPRVSPGEGCHVSLAGTALLHSTPSRDPGLQPKPKQHGWKEVPGIPQNVHISNSVCRHVSKHGKKGMGPGFFTRLLCMYSHGKQGEFQVRPGCKSTAESHFNGILVGGGGLSKIFFLL